MAEQVEPISSPMSPIVGGEAVIVAPEPVKKGPGLLWLAMILGVAIIGGSAYFYFAGQQKQVETVSNTPPALVNQSVKPNQGFNSSVPTSTPTAAVTPIVSSTDTISDIGRDLDTTTIEAGNSSEFTTDLQGL